MTTQASPAAAGNVVTITNTVSPRLLRRKMVYDENGTPYLIEVWRHMGLTTKVVRRA